MAIDSLFKGFYNYNDQLQFIYTMNKIYILTLRNVKIL